MQHRRPPQPHTFPFHRGILAVGVLFAIVFIGFVLNVRGESVWNIALRSLNKTEQGLVAFWSFNGDKVGQTSSSASYNYYRAVTIQSSQVSANLTNFPYLFSATIPELRSVANGGKVENANGYDILFASDNAGASPLDFEVERYNPATGELVAWVRVPTLSASADTTIYLLYGNPTVTASQENPGGVWDANYKGVWHLSETSGQHLDSTSNSNDSSSVVVTAQGSAAGKAGGADEFDGINDVVTIPDSASLDITNAATIEAWIKPDTTASTQTFKTWGELASAPDGMNSNDESGIDSVVVGDYNYYAALMCDDAIETFSVATSTATDFSGWFQKTPPNGCTGAGGGTVAIASDGVYVYYLALLIDSVGSTHTIAFATSTLDFTSFSGWDTSFPGSSPGLVGTGISQSDIDFVIEGDTAYVGLVLLQDGATEQYYTTNFKLDKSSSASWTSQSAPNGASSNEGCLTSIESDGATLYYRAHCHNSGTTDYFYRATSTFSGTPFSGWISDNAPNGNGGVGNGETSQTGMGVVYLGDKLYHAILNIQITSVDYLTAETDPDGAATWTSRDSPLFVTGYREDGSAAISTDGKGLFYFALTQEGTTEHFYVATATVPARPIVAKNDAYELMQIGEGYALDWSGPALSFGSTTAAGSWQHVAVTHDGAWLRMYVDGRLWRSLKTTADFFSNNNNLEIGKVLGEFGDAFYFDGMIDEVRISSAARSSDWLLTQYRNQNDPAAFSTIGTEQLNEKQSGVFTILPDAGSISLSATSSITSGAVGRALLFNGIKDTTASVNLGSVRAVALWIRPETWGVPILQLNGSVSLSLDSAGNVVATGWTSPTIYVNGSAGGGKAPLGEWTHVVVVDTSDQTASGFVLGSSGGSYFSGGIDEVRLYNRALSQEEVQDIHRLGATSKIQKTLSTQPATTKDLLLHWTLDGKDIDLGQTGAEVRDRSGSGRHGDLRVASATQVIAFGSDGTWTVPAGVSRVTIKAWGGGGGGGGALSGIDEGGGGGGGGFLQGDVTVNPGEVLTIHVGGGGGGGPGDFNRGGGGGGGGGFSGVSRDGGSTYFLIAGGGGGGGGAGDQGNDYGGGGGGGSGGSGNAGLDGQNASCGFGAGVGGGGATPSAGGSGGDGCSSLNGGTSGSFLNGGLGGYGELGEPYQAGGAGGSHGGGSGGNHSLGSGQGGGGGGGGYYGGGGGEAGDAEGAGGGGGGSGYSVGLSNVISLTGSNGTSGEDPTGGAAANTSDIDYANNAGRGGNGANSTSAGAPGSAGNPGRVVIRYDLSSGPSFTRGKIGQAAALDGIDDFLFGGDVDGGVAPRTVAFWVKFATTTANQGLVQLDLSPDTRIATDNLGNIVAGGFTAQNVYVDAVASSLIPDTEWHHIAVVLPDGLTADDFAVGSTTGAFARLGGVVDDVRLYSRALSQKEVQEIHRLGATTKIQKTLTSQPALEAGLIGHWTMDGKDVDLSQLTTEIRDRSSQGNHGDWRSHASTTAPGAIGQALDFDGVDDEVNIADPGVNSVLDLPGDFTLSAWVYPRDLSNDPVKKNPRLFQKGNSIVALDAAGAYALLLLTSSGEPYVAYMAVRIGGTTYVATSTTPLTTNRWWHIAAVRSGTALSVYVDGVLEGSIAIPSSNLDQHNEQLYLGYTQNGDGRLDGKLDDMRMYNRALSAREILQLYRLGRR